MTINPRPVLLWILGASIGFIIGGDLRSALIGFTVPFAASVVAQLFF